MQITEGGTTYDLQLDPSHDFTGNLFQLTADSGSGTLVSIDTTLSEPQSMLPVSVGGDYLDKLLLSSDRDYAAAQLTYTVLTAPVHGSILLNGTAAASFTQADIDNGLVQYRENGDVASGDGFAFQVSDPAGNRVGPEDFKIAILDTTAPVVETNKTMSVATTGSAIIPGHLSTVALGGTPAEMIYSVLTAPAHGGVLVDGHPVASFTQADIDNGLVRYQQNGDAVSSDSFTFQATDAAGDQTPVTTFNIAIQDSATIIGAAGTTIAGGSGSALINGLAGSQAISGGAGNTTVWGGPGDTITGGSGTLAVSIDQQNYPGAVLVGDNGMKGSDTVTGFSQPTGDRIFFPNETPGAISGVVASAQASNGNTLITLPDGATMTLIGIARIDSTFFA